MDEPEEQVDEQPADDSGPDADQVEPDLAEIEETWSDEPADTDVDTDVDVETAAEPTPDSEPDDTDPASEPVDSEADPVDEPEAEPEEAAEEVPVAPAVEPTGHAGVDAVLGSLEGLEQRSVHEHVGVFEEAHAALRRALDETDQQG